MLDHFSARVENPMQFAMANRVLLLRAASGVGLDIALGGLPFEESAITRSTEFIFPGDAVVRTCAAEDLIVMKAFAARTKDWMDVEGIITRQAGKLDWTYIRNQLGPLVTLKEAPEILNDLEKKRLEFES